MIFAAWQQKERLGDRSLKSPHAYFQRQELLSSQVTTDMLFIRQRGCELNSLLKKKTCFPNADIWRVLMAVARRVAGLCHCVWSYKDTGHISGEEICECHHYLKVKTFLTLKAKSKSKKNCVWGDRLYSSKAVRCDVCPVREDTSVQLHGWLLAWLCPEFLSRRWPHSSWDFFNYVKNYLY